MGEQSGSPSSPGSQGNGDCIERVGRAFTVIGIIPKRVVPLRIVPVAAALVPLGWVVYNPDIVCGLSDEELLALMAHEAYHLTMLRHRKRLVRAVLLSVLKIGLALDLALAVLAAGIFAGLGPDNPLIVVLAVFAGLIGSSQIMPKLARLGVPVFSEEVEANTFAAAVAGHQALRSLFIKLRSVRGPQALLLKLVRGF